MAKEARRLQRVREEVECLVAHRLSLQARLSTQWVEQSETYETALQSKARSSIVDRTYQLLSETDIECAASQRSLDEARAFLEEVDRAIYRCRDD